MRKLKPEEEEEDGEGDEAPRPQARAEAARKRNKPITNEDRNYTTHPIPESLLISQHRVFESSKPRDKSCSPPLKESPSS